MVTFFVVGISICAAIVAIDLRRHQRQKRRKRERLDIYV